jgi:DNA polymerase-3 subunit alpha
VFEALIKCGAFDSYGLSRAAMLAVVEPMLEYGTRLAKEKASGQASLFGCGSDAAAEVVPPVPALPEWPERERLVNEKQALGFYISGHPLKAYEKELRRYKITPVSALAERPDGEVQVAGVVASLKEIKTKKGDLMAFVVIEDLTGSVEVTVFPKVYSAASLLLRTDDPVLIRGTLERGGEEEVPKVLAESVVALSDVRSQESKELHLQLHASELTEQRMRELKHLFQTQHGHCTVLIHLAVPERLHSTLTVPDARVSASDDVLTELERMFGRSVGSFQ